MVDETLRVTFGGRWESTKAERIADPEGFGLLDLGFQVHRLFERCGECGGRARCDMQGRTPPNIVAIFETCHPQPLDNAQVKLATLVFFFTESETNESYMPAILDTKSKFMLERHTLPHAPLEWWILVVFAEIKRIRCSPRRHPQRVHKQGAFRGQQFHRCGRADRSRSSANFKSGSAAPEGGGAC